MVLNVTARRYPIDESGSRFISTVYLNNLGCWNDYWNVVVRRP